MIRSLMGDFSWFKDFSSGPLMMFKAKLAWPE
jgi:hypothetical protein